MDRIRDPQDRRARLPGAVLATALVLAVSACTEPSGPTGADTADIAATLETAIADVLETTDEGDKVRAVIVNVGGENLYELWRGDDAHDHLDARSVTKSVIGTLVGIAIDQGLIEGTDAKLGDLLPHYRGAMSDEVAGIPLSAILSHTAGFAPGGADWGIDDLDSGASTDWIATILADRVARGSSAGSFAYSNAGSHLLAAIVDTATEGSLLEYARTSFFDPLGIVTEPAFAESIADTQAEVDRQVQEYLAADFAWPADPQGVFWGSGGMKLTPEDMLTLGRLYLAGGAMGGEQIVSREWVDSATTTRTDTNWDPPGYGYQWWTGDLLGDPAFFAIGIFGNVVAVVPARDLVVVVASAWTGDITDRYDAFREGEALTLIEFVILPALDGKLVTSSSRG